MLKQITWIMLCCYPVFVSSQNVSNRNTEFPDSIATHKVMLDDQSKIISWITAPVHGLRSVSCVTGGILLYGEFLFHRVLRPVLTIRSIIFIARIKTSR